jgi:hypothetical protein
MRRATRDVHRATPRLVRGPRSVKTNLARNHVFPLPPLSLAPSRRASPPPFSTLHPIVPRLSHDAAATAAVATPLYTAVPCGDNPEMSADVPAPTAAPARLLAYSPTRLLLHRLAHPAARILDSFSSIFDLPLGVRRGAGDASL